MKTTKKRIFGAFLAVIMLVSCFAASVISSSAASITFSDVKKSDWHYEYVTYMAEKEIINGYQKNGYTEFRPNNYVKRAEFIKMLVETFGLKNSGGGTSFSDVKSSDWYYEYYDIAASKGIISEVFSGTQMLPTQELTREEAAALLMAYLDYPENDVVSSSAFDDYNSINSKYRTYVLQAAYADIINGFDDNGETNFRPKEGLRRAQAAKILAIASGTVVDGNVSRFAFDDSNNITVTKAATISGLDDIDNVIIGEDVKSGTVSFIGCTINGRVDNRSSATVVFSDCEINGVLDLNGISSNVQLKQDTDVYSLNVNVPSAKITMNSGASVTNLAANKDSLTITASGDDVKITNLKVYGNNTTCNLAPKNLEITDGKSATIGSVKYSNGLKGDAKLDWDGNTESIEFETYSAGTLYWFYSKTNSYTTSTFETAYENASVKNSITASANKKYEEKLIGGTVTDDTKYLVVSFKKGSTYTTPVSYDREAYKTGFKTLPTLTANATTGIVNISFSLQSTGGTTYYYLTNDETAPETYAIAKAIWEAVDSTIRQSTSGTSFASIQKEPAENYKYCVFFRADANNNGYKPVVVKMPTGNANFTEKPAIVVGGADNGDDVVKFVPTFAGKITYYYTDRSMSFNNNAQLFDYFAPANTAEIYSYSFDAKEKVAINIDELNENNKFLAIKITKNATWIGGADTTVLISMLERKIDGTGFKNGTTPAAYRVKNSTSNVAITFEIANASKTNSVKYMFLDTNKTYTSSADFLKDYDTTSNVKAEVTNFTSGAAELKIEQTNKYYIAFLVEDSNDRYFVPKTVSVSNTGYGISNPKFTYVDTGFEDKDGNSTTTVCKLTFDSILPLKIKYKAFDKLPSSSDLNNDPGTDLNNGNPVKVGKNEIEVDPGVLSNGTKYIYVFAYFDDLGVSLGDVKSTYSETRYGLKLTPTLSFNKNEFVDTFSYNSAANGELKWYYTNTIPGSVSEFNTGYASASFRNGATETITSGTGVIEAYPISFVNNFKYFAYLFNDGTSTVYTVRYCEVSELHTLLKDVKLSSDNKNVTYTTYTSGVSGLGNNNLVLRYYYSDYKESFANSFVTVTEKTNANGTITYDSAYYSSFKYKFDVKYKTYSGTGTLDPAEYFGELSFGDTITVTLAKNKQRYLYVAAFREIDNGDGTKSYTQYGVYEFTIPAGK